MFNFTYIIRITGIYKYKTNILYNILNIIDFKTENNLYFPYIIKITGIYKYKTNKQIKNKPFKTKNYGN